MAETLIKYETIDQEQIQQLMKGEPVTPPAGWEDGVAKNDEKKNETDLVRALRHNETINSA